MSDPDSLTPGQRLRAEREAQGISEQEAARRLNLTVSYLVALESDEYERLPQAAFVKGYIRNYARELNLPADELVASFDEDSRGQDEEVAPATEKVEVMPRRRAPVRLVVWVVLVLVLVVALVLWWQQKQQLGMPAIPAQVTDSEKADKASKARQDEAGKTASKEAESASRNGGGKNKASMSQSDSSSSSVGPGTSKSGATPVASSASDNGRNSGVDHLVMTFSSDCWIVARNAEGKVLFKGPRGAGAPLKLTGHGPFSIKVGDAAAVKMIRINGREISMPTNKPGAVVQLNLP